MGSKSTPQPAGGARESILQLSPTETRHQARSLFRKPTGRFHDSCENAKHRVARTPVKEKESEGLSLRPWRHEQAAEVRGQTQSALGRPGAHARHREQRGQPLDGPAPDGAAAAGQEPGPSPHAPRKSGRATDLDVELKCADRSSVGLDEAAESDTGTRTQRVAATHRHLAPHQ